MQLINKCPLSILHNSSELIKCYVIYPCCPRVWLRLYNANIRLYTRLYMLLGEIIRTVDYFKKYWS